MKYRLFILGLIATLCAACTVQEEDRVNPAVEDGEVFYATIEGALTKVYVDEDLKVLWHADDRVSIFNKYTFNQQYRFTGNTGANAGSFKKVPNEDFVTGNALDYVYAVYPYQETTEISNKGLLSVELPAVQAYAEDSFGIGANTMVSCSEGNELMFKNLCGYMTLRLYGADVSVSSITLKGNRNEPLAGKATVTAAIDAAPALQMDASATGEISLSLETPVTLGTTAETATTFWLVVPPTTFESGITLTVKTTDGKVFEKSTTGSLAIVRNTRSKMAALEVTPVDPWGRYLTFTSEGTTTVSLSNYNENAPVLYYSTDKTNWTQWDYSELTFTSGQPLYLCGDNPEGFSPSGTQYSQFVTAGDRFGVSGDIMSLIDSKYETTAIPSSFCFMGLFMGCSGLTAAPALPATTLTDNCYRNMFRSCSSLATAPVLPATTLAESCYYGTFQDCTSLTTAPDLPATTLAKSCYYGMFYGCTNLVTAPELPSTTLTVKCYSRMFYGCTSLTAAPELQATTLAGSCYSSMFYGCTSLTAAPELPATTLADYCYSGLFYGCSGLTAAPELPATTLAAFCYSNMFTDCPNLAATPELPATTLARNCYAGMFRGCTSLTAAPVLSAKALADYCYNNMFYGCTSLTTAPELPAKTLAYSCYSDMFRGCTNLTTAPELSAKVLADRCYYNMFYGCTNLTTAPELPAEALTDSCYSGMFRGCTSLTTAPELPATTLAKNCYSAMFRECTSLTSVPELLATTLADYCYGSMFNGCTSLTTAPDLPATTLAEACYKGMFYGCSQLNYVKCLATDISANECLTNWMEGVAATGTFVKAPGMTSWPTGSSGIPEGWTVEDYKIIVNTFLTFTSEGTTTVSLSNYEGNSPVLFYSTDKTNWTLWDYSELTFTSGQPLYLCGDNPEGFSSRITTDNLDGTGSITTTKFNRFVASGDNFGVSGDIMSLIDSKNETTVIPSSYCFYRLFMDCTGLTTAPGLPATTLADRCYYYMFSGCTSLMTAPELPATTLADWCYSSMFRGCTSLTTAPELPAKALADHCYYNMFNGCTCLTKAPELPATTLASSCYSSMFNGCTSLTTAPELPATTLADRCYYGMFSGCTSLTTAPVLPSITLAERCYLRMFNGCTSLTTAPDLPATTLTERCYYSMFDGCTSLNSIKCLAKDISANECLLNWMERVAASGTFVKAPGMTSWPTGASGIPEGWMVIDDTVEGGA